MKKLIVAAVAVVLGVAANAASCNWEIKSDWVSADGENPLMVSVYAFDAIASSLSDVSTALAKNDTSVLAGALANTTVNDEGWFKLTGNGISDDGKTPFPSASVFNILIADDGAGNFYFYATDTKSVELTDAIIAGQANFAWDEISTGAIGTGSWQAMSVPEPTSGLLMLLGMAGLALRRRRA